MQTEEEKKEYRRQWHIRNKEKQHRYGKEYRDTHKEKIKAHSKEYNDSHKEELKEYHKEFYIINKERITEHQKQYSITHKKEHKKYNDQYCIDHKKEIAEHKKQYNLTHKEERKKYLTENKERLKISRKPYHKKLKFKKHNITEEQYKLIFDKQEGKCKICDRHQDKLKKALHIDHNHATGKIRGLLCFKCNTLLGYADDNIIRLESAIDYLKNND